PELPPFTPRLDDFRLDEFHQQSLTLLAFPAEHDQSALDLAPFQIELPAPPPEPPLPLLPYVWYPRPTQAVRDWALGRLMPLRSTPLLGKTRLSEAQRLLRPLLAGEGPVEVRAASGLGKSTLLAYLASHERTRQRYRRIWWLDDPQHLPQTLALALNLPTVLTETDLTLQIHQLRDALDDETLLVIDNASPAQAAYLRELSTQIVLGIETPPEVLDDDVEPEPDPEGVVTLRSLPRADAMELMVHACGLTDRNSLRGQMRAWMSHLVQLLGGHPLAIMVAGALFAEDSLPMERLVELFSSRIDPDNPQPEMALDISLDALPSDYYELLLAFGGLPPVGASFEAIVATAKLNTELAGHRGLSFLLRRGFIRRDSRLGAYYVAQRDIWHRMAAQVPQQKKTTEQLRTWVLEITRRYREDAGMVYRFQREILYALGQAQQERANSFIHKLNLSLGAYLREYAPTYLTADTPVPDLVGDRARAATLIGDGLRFLDRGMLEEAEAAFTEGLKQTDKHGSEHEMAEALVAAARYADFMGEYQTATNHLERAAKLVFDLKAEESLHLIRIALAMVYRKQERYKDALGVLDDTPDAYPERVRIYRATQQWELMLKTLELTDDVSPYTRAEAYLQADRYAEALAALANARDSQSAFLRAVIYHLQDDVENAVRGYEMALDMVSKQSAQRVDILLAMSKAYVGQGEHEKAQRALVQALDVYPTLGKPAPILRARTLGLQAALSLLNRQHDRAIKLAQQALEAIKRISPTEGARDRADIQRTLGRALWQCDDKAQARDAFEAEVNHAQSVPKRDEIRIGLGLHHLADAYRDTSEPERAIANYRRALTHLDPEETPQAYFITQVALQAILAQEGRLGQALEITQAAIKQLEQRSPVDLQHIGYMLVRQAQIEQELGQLKQAVQTLGRWTTLLAGRADARQDNRAGVALLALKLAVHSLLAHQRADEAVEFAELALKIAERHYPGTAIAWSSRRDLGKAHLDTGNWQSAIDMLASVRFDEVKSEAFTFSLSQAYTATAHAYLGNYAAALEHFQQALEYQPIAHQKALILDRMADIHLEIQDTDQAISHVQQALPFLDREHEPGDTARILTKLARLLSGTNQYAESIQVYEDALEMLRNLPDVDPVHTARVYKSLAASHEAQGQYTQAAIAYRNALDTLETARKASPDDHREVLARLAAVRVNMAQYDEAIALYLQARSETEMYGTPHDLGLVVSALADTYRQAGNLEEAMYTYEEALKVQPADDVPRERAATLRGYGQTLSILNRLPEARDAWTEALTITTDAPALEVALTHRSIALAFSAQEMYYEAEKAFKDALDYHLAGTSETAHTWRLSGRMLVDAGRHGDAIHPLQKALEIEKSLAQQVNGRIVETLDLLAKAHEAVGDLAAAIASHHEALVYMDRNHQPIQTANRYRLMGRLYAGQGRWLDAHKALEEALVIEMNYKPRSDTRIAQTLEIIAHAYRKEGNLHKAAEAYKRMASYANLSKAASNELKETMSEIEKYEGTLEAARSSLAVLQRTSDADIKDLVYVYALVARSHAGLSQHEGTNDAIDKLLTVLEENADKLSTADERIQYRALAHVFEGSQAASTGNLVEARAHFQRALHETSDPSMRWVIEQGLASVQS
ncbi:MAG: tetratricopeptide repeat protein, partial [Chloroflexi bacterium]|nr:tetratricopeptide repeat protein [Chloroflexota bacterium]